MGWIRATRQAFYEAFIRPVWATNAKLGPFAGLLVAVAGVVVGFVSKQPLVGIIFILAGAVILALLALAIRIVEDTVAVPVADEHRNYIKGVAQSYRAALVAGSAIRVGDDDWLVIENHFPSVATQLRDYNDRLITVDTRERELRDHIARVVEGSRVQQRFHDQTWDFIVKLMGRLVGSGTVGLEAPITYRWSDLEDVQVVETDVTGGNQWALVSQEDLNSAAVRAEIEQTVHDVQRSAEAKALVAANANLHKTQNEVAKSIDRIGRLVTITGICPDCVVV